MGDDLFGVFQGVGLVVGAVMSRIHFDGGSFADVDLREPDQIARQVPVAGAEDDVGDLGTDRGMIVEEIRHHLEHACLALRRALHERDRELRLGARGDGGRQLGPRIPGRSREEPELADVRDVELLFGEPREAGIERGLVHPPGYSHHENGAHLDVRIGGAHPIPRDGLAPGYERVERALAGDVLVNWSGDLGFLGTAGHRDSPRSVPTGGSPPAYRLRDR